MIFLLRLSKKYHLGWKTWLMNSITKEVVAVGDPRGNCHRLAKSVLNPLCEAVL